jgi:hypothetical protein
MIGIIVEGALFGRADRDGGRPPSLCPAPVVAAGLQQDRTGGRSRMRWNSSARFTDRSGRKRGAPELLEEVLSTYGILMKQFTFN